METICLKYQILFSEKNVINFSSVELAQIEVEIKIDQEVVK